MIRSVIIVRGTHVFWMEDSRCKYCEFSVAETDMAGFNSFEDGISWWESFKQPYSKANLGSGLIYRSWYQ